MYKLKRFDGIDNFFATKYYVNYNKYYVNYNKYNVIIIYIMRIAFASVFFLNKFFKVKIY